MRTAIAAMLNAVDPQGIDLSNGATAWDGAEQAKMDGTTCSSGNFSSHAAQFGWTIHTNHYNSWKESIDSKFSTGTFVAPQHNAAIGCAGYKSNEGLYR